MSRQNLDFGKIAESTALKFLEAQGYKILQRNYKTKFSEIDIIAEEKNVLCFVEVKARHSDMFGEPHEAVARSKQRQISKAAIWYLKENNAFGRAARFDVVSLLYTQDRPVIDLIKDAFELSSNFTV